MDVTATTTTTVPDLDSRQPESEDPTRIHPAKPISFSNGKRTCHNHHPTPVVLAVYRECLKNHAASIGGHALDGCGEFMPSPSFNSNDPASLTCAACGCHRNFHRLEQDPSTIVSGLEFRPYNRHQLPPPPPHPPVGIRSPHGDDDSASPPPISSSYMLLALSGGGGGSTVAHHHHQMTRKRFRTKFSQFQKERMFEFAERVGWKMPKAEDVDVKEFCREIGVDKTVFKVWMHNNKISGGRNSGGGGGGGAKRGYDVGGGGGGAGVPIPPSLVPPATNGSVSST